MLTYRESTAFSCAVLFLNCVFLFSVEGVSREKEENHESL